MNLEQTVGVNVPDHYEVHDITVVTTDGKHATADVVYSRNGGDLVEMRVEYTRSNTGTAVIGVPVECWAIVHEIVAECREACLYQRDLLREMH